MKKYPVRKIITQGGGFSNEPVTLLLPTREAMDEFESYLEEKELELYKSLTDIEQIDLAMSVDPFHAFKMRYLSK